jgi:glycosyltransferase involved in cell wall biosynthesis
MNRKSLTIIVPCFNSDKYVHETLISIDLLSNLVDLEVFLIDDQSLDNTLEIINDYASKRNFAKVIVNLENYGVSHSRNIGLNQASHEFVYFLDSDDVLIPQSISSLIDKLVSEKLDFIVGSWVFYSAKYSFVNSGYDHHWIRTISESDYSYNSDEAVGRLLNCWGLTGSKIYRTDFLRLNDLSFDSRLSFFEDFDFFIQALHRNKKYGISLVPAYAYRVGQPNQVTMKSDEITINKMIKSSEIILRKIAELATYQPIFGVAKIHILNSLFSTVRRFSASTKHEFILQVRGIQEIHFGDFDLGLSKYMGIRNQVNFARYLWMFRYFVSFWKMFKIILLEFPQIVVKFRERLSKFFNRYFRKKNGAWG